MANKNDVIQPIRGTFDQVVDALLPKVNKAAPAELLSGDNFQVVQYAEKGEIDPIDFRLDADTQSIWATQAQMAALFDTTQPNISTHHCVMT